MNELIIFPKIFDTDTVGLVIKIFQLILLGLFVVYSFLTIRQVDIMNHSLLTKIHFELKLLAYFQLFVGIGVLFLILIR